MGQLEQVAYYPVKTTRSLSESVTAQDSVTASLNGGGGADPTQLPIASGQTPTTRPSAASSGDTYSDPETGVTVVRITDGSTPVASNVFGAPDYADGGPYISQAWQSGGETYYTLYVWVDSSPNDHYFVDLKYSDLTLSNWRQLANMTNRDLCWCWSLNPSTPHVGYGTSMPEENILRQFDTTVGVMAEITDGDFPYTFPSGRLVWLQNSLNDTWFVASIFSGTVVRIVKPSVPTEYAKTISDLDEPRIDRAGNYAYAIHDTAVPGCTYSGLNHTSVIDLSDGSVLSIAPSGQTDFGGRWAAGCKDELWNTHPTAVQDYYVTQLPDIAPDGDEYYYDPVTDTIVFFKSRDALHDGSGHRAGQWVIGNGSGTDQWYLVSGWSGAGDVREGIAFVKLDGSAARLLCHHYSSGASYGSEPHATMSPDGKLVMWQSDNDGGENTHCFVAKVPTS